MRRVFQQLVNTEKTPEALKVILAVDLLTLSVLAITALCLVYYLAFGHLGPMDWRRFR